MKYKLLPLIALAALAAAHADAHAGRCVNKDLKNLGPTAYDVAVVLSGNQYIPWHYDGYALGTGNGKEGVFSSFSVAAPGSDTLLHWQDFWDGVDTAINTGQTIHIGWCTSGKSSIRNMYWTDRNGRPLPLSIIYNIVPWYSQDAAGFSRAVFVNLFGRPIFIRKLAIAVVPVALPLDRLNTENGELAAAMQPVPGGEGILVDAGARVEIPLPGVNLGDTVVARFSVDGSEGSAEALDFVQAIVEDAAAATAGAGAK